MTLSLLHLVKSWISIINVWMSVSGCLESTCIIWMLLFSWRLSYLIVPYPNLFCCCLCCMLSYCVILCCILSCHIVWCCIVLCHVLMMCWIVIYHFVKCGSISEIRTSALEWGALGAGKQRCLTLFICIKKRHCNDTKLVENWQGFPKIMSLSHPKNDSFSNCDL